MQQVYVPEYRQLPEAVDKVMCARFKQWAYSMTIDGTKVFVKPDHVGLAKQLLKAHHITGCTVFPTERF